MAGLALAPWAEQQQVRSILSVVTKPRSKGKLNRLCNQLHLQCKKACVVRKSMECREQFALSFVAKETITILYRKTLRNKKRRKQKSELF